MNCETGKVPAVSFHPYGGNPEPLTVRVLVAQRNLGKTCAICGCGIALGQRYGRYTNGTLASVYCEREIVDIVQETEVAP